MENPSELDSFTGEIKEALQNNNQSLAATKIQELLDKEKNTRLDIAITGESGSGKSTFVNAFRGIDNKDEGAAPTGCVETTTEVTPYPHPNYPNVTFWDLPGIGTTRFPADKYLKHVGFERFDFFIIISDTRFRENDVKLAQEIQRMGKRFYFVRSKIDNDLRAEERSQRDFSEERTLIKIRENCVQGLTQQGIVAPQVFLVSSFELGRHDFSVLHETLERELPEHKRNALLMAMPNINLEIINKKKKGFKAKIKYFALLSAVVASAPVPGLSIACDVALLVGVVTKYVIGFGLDIPSLQRLAKSTGVPFKDLMAVIISPVATTKVTSDLILKVITSFSTTAVLMAAEEVSRFIPIFGIPASVALSFITTKIILNNILSMLAEDAENVFKRALKMNTSV
ncbi:interferon-inducible GTPase 5-like [Mugil cephalus]|uniref:interferon-inducible GTPase 5-like n=1 Tax=Mugil cephalus TaxID=48193 RepID=UPI001FB815E7|nr:interferon-inducible GTPase 5-like [Mugil cephalus]